MTHPAHDRAAQEFVRLLEVMHTLRAPGGCSWDRAQTHQTLRKFTIEEAQEVVDAVDKGDPLHLQEELGDLAMMVAFHAEIAAEAGTFTMTEVMRGIVEKLIQRHPHVFGTVDNTLTPEKVVDMWGQLKKEEKKNRSRISHRMREAAGFASAVQSALQIQGEAARVGFDFPHWQPALAKIAEEAEELAQAKAQDDAAAVRQEFGDLFFALLNVARLLQVDPETALREATNKFVERFARLEGKAEAAGGFVGKTIEEMDAWWNQVKADEADTEPSGEETP